MIKESFHVILLLSLLMGFQLFQDQFVEDGFFDLAHEGHLFLKHFSFLFEILQ